eukprot:1160412-Pelagomonas_calceolata.AAC.9
MATASIVRPLMHRKCRNRNTYTHTHIPTPTPTCVAYSMRRVSFSPTTLPIEPPMKPNSMTPKATGIPCSRPVPVRTPSCSPVLACASRMRSV